MQRILIIEDIRLLANFPQLSLECQNNKRAAVLSLQLRTITLVLEKNSIFGKKKLFRYSFHPIYDSAFNHISIAIVG